MSLSSIVSSIAEEFFACTNENILYLSLPLTLMNKLPGLIKKKIIVLDLANDYSPLRPFLSLISQYEPSVELLEKESYSLQKSIFESYFKTGAAGKRKDPIIFDEIYYEKKRCFETVIALLENLVTDRCLILNAQKMGKESIEILKDLENSKFNGKMIFCFDMAKTKSSSVINEYLEEICNRKNYFEITDYKNSYLSVNTNKIKNFPDFEPLYTLLKNDLAFFAFDQAHDLSQWIVDNLAALNFSSMQQRSLYMEMAAACFYYGKAEESSFYLNNVLEKQVNDELDVKALFFLSQVLLLKNANASALKYANLALQKFEQNHNHEYYALSYMMYYKITERTENISSLEKYNKAQQLLEDCDFPNNRIHALLTMPYTLVDDPEGRKIIMSNAEAAVKHAEEIGNKFALSTAYHWKGIVHSHDGHPDEAFVWYSKCNDIRTEIGELSAIIKIRNAISYEYLTHAEYHRAYDLINSFVNRLTEINDYSEIIITLTNAAKTLFFSRHFKDAYNMFQKISNLMQMFDMEIMSCNSFLPGFNDILIFKAITDFTNGDIIRAKISLHNIINNGKLITLAVSPFRHFLEALIEANDGNLKKSIECFNRGKDISLKIEQMCGHQLVFMYFEYAVVLDRLDYKKEAEEFRKKGFELAAENRFSYFTQNKKDVTIAEYLNNSEEFAPVAINLGFLLESAEKERLMNQLQKRLCDSRFLNKIMSLGCDQLNKIKYAGNIVQATFDYTMAEAVYLAEKTNGEWTLVSAVSRTEMKTPSGKVWERLLAESRMEGHDHLFFDEQQHLIFGDISKFEFIGGVIIVPNQNAVFTLEDYNVINIAISNLQAQLVMLKQNEHLLFISSTDQLSMLRNRRALQEQLALESEMIRRYQNKRDMHFQVAISFMDLDNFKYYNDTFGHEAGDLLIAKFASLLKSVYRKVDFVSRFGGDEFVILLPNTNCSEASRAAERVQTALKEAKYFIPDLERLLGKKLNIADNRKLGFSTGICSNFEIDDPTNMEKTMTAADHALYYSKQHKKGSISIWEEIKDDMMSSECITASDSDKS